LTARAPGIAPGAAQLTYTGAMRARRLLQIILLIQAVCALGIGLGAVHWFDAAPWQGALLGIAAVVLVRLAINVNNFLLSARVAGPTPPAFRLRPLARLRMLAEEFASSMLLTSWHMPRARPHTRIHPDAPLPPVLLVHGYGCNSGYWAQLAPLLDNARISHATLDLEPLTGDIDGYAAQVEAKVDELCKKTGAPRVAIVGHSMGGVVGRAWMRAYGSARLARLITLGSPHHGTCLASFGIGLNAAQMGRLAPEGPACDWLQALDASEDPARRALVTSIYTHHDNIVSPRITAELAGARNLALGGVGHVALGSNRRVLAAVMAELDALRQNRVDSDPDRHAKRHPDWAPTRKSASTSAANDMPVA
jgi:triacylglycerol esterase/lipase EstA (alpha/beta hydrolase family)